jgi:hypothetical protein
MASILPSAIPAMEMFQTSHVCYWRKSITSQDHYKPKYLIISSFLFSKHDVTK